MRCVRSWGPRSKQLSRPSSLPVTNRPPPQAPPSAPPLCRKVLAEHRKPSQRRSRRRDRQWVLEAVGGQGLPVVWQLPFRASQPRLLAHPARPHPRLQPGSPRRVLSSAPTCFVCHSTQAPPSSPRAAPRRDDFLPQVARAQPTLRPPPPGSSPTSHPLHPGPREAPWRASAPRSFKPCARRDSSRQLLPLQRDGAGDGACERTAPGMHRRQPPQQSRRRAPLKSANVVARARRRSVVASLAFRVAQRGTTDTAGSRSYSTRLSMKHGRARARRMALGHTVQFKDNSCRVAYSLGFYTLVTVQTQINRPPWTPCQTPGQTANYSPASRIDPCSRRRECRR